MILILFSSYRFETSSPKYRVIKQLPLYNAHTFRGSGNQQAQQGWLSLSLLHDVWVSSGKTRSSGLEPPTSMMPGLGRLEDSTQVGLLTGAITHGLTVELGLLTARFPEGETREAAFRDKNRSCTTFCDLIFEIIRFHFCCKSPCPPRFEGRMHRLHLLMACEKSKWNGKYNLPHSIFQMRK